MDVLGRVVEVASGMPFDQFLPETRAGSVGNEGHELLDCPENESRWARKLSLESASHQT